MSPTARFFGSSIVYIALIDSPFNQNVLEQPRIDLVLADAFDERRAENKPVVDTLTRWFARSLSAPVIETLGLALAAALAS